MNTPNDGGPAFPRPPVEYYCTYSGEKEFTTSSGGMSLRAWFVGQVLSPMLVQAYGTTPEILAKKAVEIADALIAELNKSK